ncbi:hypothetical protein V1264_000417 [Littorina saxatilis]|uniref:Uncharacterized protein n=1 Tax=Littorina saxatilis TaxID=31220 RepID=A0AAN9BZA4_9CAEN
MVEIQLDGSGFNPSYSFTPILCWLAFGFCQKATAMQFHFAVVGLTVLLFVLMTFALSSQQEGGEIVQGLDPNDAHRYLPRRERSTPWSRVNYRGAGSGYAKTLLSRQKSRSWSYGRHCWG